MKRLCTALTIASFSALLPGASFAQSNAELVQQFRTGFERGCNQGQTMGVRDQKGYCSCMANSFQSRFSGLELSAISESASALGDQGPAIINLMMAPEAKACTAKY